MSEAERERRESTRSDRTRGEEMRDNEDSKLLGREREDAQGIEVFSDPDSLTPASALVEGEAGHETLTSDEFAEEDHKPEG